MKTRMIGLVAAALLLGTVAGAEDAPFGMQIKARQGLMNYMALNIGVLGGMAKGEVAYDAKAAQTAADNIAAISNLDESMIWPKGSDNGANPATHALPAIWEDGSKIGEKLAALHDGAVAMQAAAGKDLDSLKAAMGGLGGACGDCHKTYRASF
jgi:cytochrome c556